MKAFLTAAAATLALASLSVGAARSAPLGDAGVYFDAAELSCPNAAACEVMLTAVPAQMTVTQASCTITLSNAAKIGDLQLRRRKGAVITRQTLAPIQALPVDGSTTRHVVNASALLALKPLDRPTIHLALRGGAVATVTMNCTVHGPYEAEM